MSFKKESNKAKRLTKRLIKHLKKEIANLALTLVKKLNKNSKSKQNYSLIKNLKKNR